MILVYPSATPFQELASQGYNNVLVMPHWGGIEKNKIGHSTLGVQLRIAGKPLEIDPSLYGVRLRQRKKKNKPTIS